MQKCLLLLLQSTLEACCAACAEEPLLDLSPAWRPGEFTMSGLSVSAPGRCKRACLSGGTNNRSPFHGVGQRHVRFVPRWTKFDILRLSWLPHNACLGIVWWYPWPKKCAILRLFWHLAPSFTAEKWPEKLSQQSLFCKQWAQKNSISRYAKCLYPKTM